MNAIDKSIYKISIFLLSALIALGIIVNLNIFNPTTLGFACYFREATGLLCPGCNGTHSVCALISGNIIESFLLHPFVPVTTAIILGFTLWNMLCLLFNKKSNTKLPYWHFHIAFVYIILAALFIPWIIKNILIIVN